MVLTGDVQQSDVGESNGLTDLVEKMNVKADVAHAVFDVVNFGDKDIIRSKLCEQVMELYR
jgi:phosphate starvation-inducible protein PhoH